MTTQMLVVFCIRTRRQFFRSKPDEFLAVMNVGAVAVAIGLPFLPWVWAPGSASSRLRRFSSCSW